MKHLLPLFVALALIGRLDAAPRTVGRFDRTLSVAGPVDLDAMTASGGIVVTGGGTAGIVRVHGYLEANDTWPAFRDVDSRIREMERNPPVEQSGNRVRVGYPGDTHILDGISMRLEIEVPRDTVLHARANSGAVRVSGVGGPVECETHSGGIRIARVSGAVTARARSGGIDVTDAASSIDVHANSGGIHLSQARAGSIRAQTGSGGVTVQLAPDAGYDLSVDTGSGRITTPQMTVRSGFSRHHVEGKVRGGGAPVSIRAGSGSVRID